MIDGVIESIREKFDMHNEDFGEKQVMEYFQDHYGETVDRDWAEAFCNYAAADRERKHEE